MNRLETTPTFFSELGLTETNKKTTTAPTSTITNSLSSPTKKLTVNTVESSLQNATLQVQSHKQAMEPLTSLRPPPNQITSPATQPKKTPQSREQTQKQKQGSKRKAIELDPLSVLLGGPQKKKKSYHKKS